MSNYQPHTSDPSKQNHYQIGIDAGSKTIKVTLCDENGQAVHSLYRRHQSNIRETLYQLVHELSWRYGQVKGTIAVTGSAGIGVATALDIPFVQEVVATTKIVQKEYPQADAVIELGGEDAKIIYLTGPGGIEQRMNSTCAGGTGNFIDTIAYMLGVRTKEMDTLSMSASRVYPIASRCAVFAQTDIRPLLNAGAKTNDLAASALDAVVRQTIGGLACGRPIQGTVVFLGGPCEYISNLVQRFRRALGLNSSTGIKPPHAELMTARGAALYGAELPVPVKITFRELEKKLLHADFSDDSIGHLPALFTNDAEIKAFRERHAKAVFPRSPFSLQKGPLYVGIDAGSTTVKVAIINEEGTLVYGDYQDNDGDVIKTTCSMLSHAYVQFPHTYSGDPYVYVAQSVATGYGEDILISGLGVDSGVVETTAHVRGAMHFEPDVSFVLDIGGQDMKAIWVKNGIVDNAVLNEACSSGCGSFISGTAYSLHVPQAKFSGIALTAPEPIDLGTKCTVFMSSRVKHAQKTGARVEDLAAGCAYSVVKNALFRIIGIQNLDSLGDKIVVQGGTFMNDAILRAFELISGKNVIRPDRANLMGAIGAALIARDRAHDKGVDIHSTLINRDQLKEFKPVKTSRICEGCANSCILSLVNFGQERVYVSGNKCMKAVDLYAKNQNEHATPAPNAIAVERSLLERYTSIDSDGPLGVIRLGIMNTLLTAPYVPFWHTVFAELGFSIRIPDATLSSKYMRTGCVGTDTIPSESVCYSAKCSHARLHALAESGATHVFMPEYARGINCPVSTGYVNALQDGAIYTEPLASHFIKPPIRSPKPWHFIKSPESLESLWASLNEAAQSAGTTIDQKAFIMACQKGIREQELFEQKIHAANQHVMQWIESNPNHYGVVLLGRPYHVDKEVSHNIDAVIAGLGMGVLSATAISHEEAPRYWRADNWNIWLPSSRMLRIAQYTCNHERLNLVLLQSFGCIYDGISLDDVREYMEEHGQLYTALKIDDIVDTAHIRIRLRTLAENIEQTARQKKRGLYRPTTPALKSLPVLRQYAPIDARYVLRAHAADVRAFEHFEMADIEMARTYTRDLCFSTAAIVGRTLRLLQADTTLNTITLPAICTDCALTSVPRIVSRITQRKVMYLWQTQWPVSEDMEQRVWTHVPETAAPTRPRIGVIGTAALVFDSYLNDQVIRVIEDHGCQVLLPELQGLLTEDVRYLDQLDAFYKRGVKSVIYLQSFGCLKGHVQARGALHELQERYPGMRITVLDYDPEASALNRENRVLLTLAAALDI